MSEGKQTVVQKSKSGDQQAQIAGRDQKRIRQSQVPDGRDDKPGYVRPVALLGFVAVLALIVVGAAGVVAWTVAVPLAVAVVAATGFVVKLG